MFARILVIVLSAGSTGLLVLTLRQEQLRAGHELASARLELIEVDERIHQIRARIAEKTSPESIRRLGDALGELVPAHPDMIDRSSDGQSSPPMALKDAT